MQEEIDFFLEEKEREKPSQEKPKSDSSNPFKALLGGYNSKSGPKPKLDSKKAPIIIRKDNYVEKEYIRPLAEQNAKEFTFKFFDIYKKAHQMPSYT